MNGTPRTIAIALLSIAGLVSLALLAAGLFFSLSERGSGDGLVLAGAVCFVVTASASGVAALLLENDTHSSGEDMVSILRDVNRSIRGLRDQAALSDDARRVLNRSNERELLCRAIEEDIRRHDWEAAQVLTTELAARFGYEQDAERFRMQIDLARAEGMDADIADRVAGLDRMIVERRWEAAFEEARRIAEAFPASQRVRSLTDRVSRSRQQYKEDLERRFLLAAQADRVDEAMDLLRELDTYLSEQEAEPFREVARGVIGKAKENLGAAFKLAYQDRQWGMAVGLGEQIIEQFPNSRMAAEARTLLPELQERARGALA
ncbi:MAG: hypothetical protein ACTS22_06150 [Phycisphaerales bacterium]